jgi:hypothetical protein
MTLSNQPIRYRYEGNGTTDEFSFPSRLFKTSDLIVQIVDRATNVIEGTLVSPADYTLVISSDGEGTITTTSPVANDKDILLFRDSDLIQPLSLPTGTPFPARDTETELDRAMAVLQEHNDRLNRAAIVNEAAPDNIAIALPVPIEGRFLVWDDVNGTIVNSSGSAEDLITSAAASAATATAQAGIATTQAGIATNAASAAVDARDDILNDAGFIAVAADLAGADTIGTVAADIADVVTAAANITAIQAAPQAAIDAEAARDKAAEWADNPEDDPVETGPDRFSAFHWAQKAQDFATGAASNISYDPTGNTVITGTNVQDALDDVEPVLAALGTAAVEDVGTAAGNVVQLDGSARLPAVDGSQLTGLPLQTPYIFQGTRTTGNVTSGNVISMSNVDINQGGCWASDKFTVPRNGFARVGAFFIAGSNTCRVSIRKNGTEYYDSYVNNSTHAGGRTIIIPVSTSDEIDFFVSNGTVTGAAPGTPSTAGSAPVFNIEMI